MTGVSDRTLFILNASLLVGVRNSLETLQLFQQEKHVFMRQTEQGLYGAAAYLSSRVIMKAPMFLFFPLVFSAIAFPLVGLNVSTRRGSEVKAESARSAAAVAAPQHLTVGTAMRAGLPGGCHHHTCPRPHFRCPTLRLATAPTFLSSGSSSS